MKEERKLLDDRVEQLALKCSEQQKEILEWEDKLESKEAERMEMRDSHLANVEQLNKELTEQLKNETILNDANKFNESERKLTEEIENLNELRKSMETTVQVLMADNNMLGERLAEREDGHEECLREVGKVSDITEVESRLYTLLFESLKKEISIQIRQQISTLNEQQDVFNVPLNTPPKTWALKL
ncbi:hypothetical protein HHI36_019649 [Cryptolaemus montrouzieri]|uniref:Uncharacterized protein n=1 Tax=Cryptolaemus montrouzieri TaxID=559131 RepID=A0ABD2N8G6_9CUCU